MRIIATITFALVILGLLLISVLIASRDSSTGSSGVATYSFNDREYKTHSPEIADLYNSSLTWLRTHTEPNVTILASWNYGHAIQMSAHRNAILLNPSAPIFATTGKKAYDIAQWEDDNGPLANHTILKAVALALSSENMSQTIALTRQFGAQCIFVSRNDPFFLPVFFYASVREDTPILTESENQSIFSYVEGRRQQLGFNTTLTNGYAEPVPIDNSFVSRAWRRDSIDAMSLLYSDDTSVVYCLNVMGDTGVQGINGSV